MEYLVTLQDNRKFGVTANSINHAAVLATQMLAKVPVGTSVLINKPSNLLNWWKGSTNNCEITFKIKPTADWNRG